MWPLLRTEHHSNDEKKPVRSVLLGHRFERSGKRGPSMTSREGSPSSHKCSVMGHRRFNFKQLWSSRILSIKEIFSQWWSGKWEDLYKRKNKLGVSCTLSSKTKGFKMCVYWQIILIHVCNACQIYSRLEVQKVHIRYNYYSKYM